MTGSDQQTWTIAYIARDQRRTLMLTVPDLHLSLDQADDVATYLHTDQSPVWAVPTSTLTGDNGTQYDVFTASGHVQVYHPNGDAYEIDITHLIIAFGCAEQGARAIDAVTRLF